MPPLMHMPMWWSPLAQQAARGRIIARRRFLADRTVWALTYDRPLVNADLTAVAAIGCGVTNELSTMVPYTVPQLWASAVDEYGWDGISYRTRFNPHPR